MVLWIHIFFLWACFNMVGPWDWVHGSMAPQIWTVTSYNSKHLIHWHLNSQLPFVETIFSCSILYTWSIIFCLRQHHEHVLVRYVSPDAQNINKWKIQHARVANILIYINHDTKQLKCAAICIFVAMHPDVTSVFRCFILKLLHSDSTSVRLVLWIACKRVNLGKFTLRM